MVSLKDIAEKCNVSVATVSKALNGKEDIGKSTRDKIRRIAEEMGYLSNASARALKTNRTYNIGVLFIDQKEAGLAHEYFSKILESFKSHAEDKGYDITFINRTVGGMQSSYLKHCIYRSFDGVAIICADFTDPQIEELATSGIPAVTIDYTYPDCPSVTSDNTKGLQELTNYAISRGHTRIAYIYGDDTEVTKKRLMGYYDSLYSANIPIRNEYVIAGQFHDIDVAEAATKQLLSLKEPPTCIIFPDDYSYFGGRKAIFEAGLSIPNDISVIGYDGIQTAKIYGLTTYAQDTTSLGTIACRKLIDAIEGNSYSNDCSIVSGSLFPGNTVAQI